MFIQLKFFSSFIMHWTPRLYSGFWSRFIMDILYRLYICAVENPVNQSLARKGFFPFPINRLISYQTLFWFFSPNTSKQISPISSYLKTKPELSALHLRYFINSYSYIKLININAVSVQRLWEDNVNYLFTLTGISSPIIIKSFKINSYHKKIL